MIFVLKGGVATTQSKEIKYMGLTCNCRGSIPSAQASDSVKAAVGNIVFA